MGLGDHREAAARDGHGAPARIAAIRSACAEGANWLASEDAVTDMASLLKQNI